LLVDN